MIIAGRTVLVTGANRGIGEALVEEALKRGAKRVYAGTRRPLSHADGRVTPVTLDVTNAAHIQAAVEQIDSLDLLINNAGVVAYEDMAEPDVLDPVLAVNFYAVRDIVHALLPKLVESKGAIATNISVNAFAAFPLAPSYSISKAAVFALMQALRGILAPQGVSVHAILTGVVDTPMTEGLDVPKVSTAHAANGIFDGIEKGEDDIFPDPKAEGLADSWLNGSGKELERMSAEWYAQFSQRG